MKYSSAANADLVVMLLIAEHTEITGYGITRAIEERGYRAWAGVGATSVYIRLKKLEERAMVESRPDLEKQSRGPTGRVYSLTKEGRSRLLAEVESALASTREHDPRFNIALSGIQLLSTGTATSCLDARLAFLTEEHQRISELAANSPGAGNLARDLLFDRSLHAIDAEQEWVARAKRRIARAVGGVSA